MKTFLNRRTLVLILCGLLLAVLWFVRSRFHDNSDSSNLGTVERKDFIQRVTIAGSVSPSRKSVVTAPYNGYVKKLFVKLGDKVKVGDPIVSIVQSLQSTDSSYPLRSPFSGVVVQVEKSEGEYAREGDAKDFILRIDDTSKMYVYASAPETDRAKIKTGQEAIIKASAILSRKYKGVIRELSLAAREKDQWSRSQVVEFPVKIEVIDGDQLLNSGMSVVLDIITEKKENVLMIRHEFIRRDGDKYFVLLGKGVRKDIEVGSQNEDGFEIKSGVTEKQRLRQVDFSEIGSSSLNQ